MTKKMLKQQNGIMREALLKIAGGNYDPDETIPDDDIKFHLFQARAAIRRMEGRAQFALNYVEELENTCRNIFCWKKMDCRFCGSHQQQADDNINNY